MIYFLTESHYYIDGTVYGEGKLLLLAYDEKEGKYYQVEKNGYGYHPPLHADVSSFSSSKKDFSKHNMS